MDWRALWLAVAAGLLILAFAPFSPLAADTPRSCASVDLILDNARERHWPVIVQNGYLGRQLAILHHEVTGFQPDAPVWTVILTRAPSDGEVTLRLQIGEFACEPARFTGDEWAKEMIIIRGQGA